MQIFVSLAIGYQKPVFYVLRQNNEPAVIIGKSPQKGLKQIALSIGHDHNKVKVNRTAGEIN